MKYIKSFNESFENDIEIIKDITESSLVYLLDEGFKIDYTSPNFLNMPSSVLRVAIKVFASKEYDVTWNNIKDYFIPFIQRLKESYKLRENCFIIFTEPPIWEDGEIGKKSMSLSIDRLLNDSEFANWWEIFCELKIESITIYVED